jgi:site-specific recombinase XerC
MTALAPHLGVFLREHLPRERRASPHTCEAYAQSFCILVGFAARRLRIRPYRLEIEQLDAPLILAFLEHIETDRGNSGRTRNARLAAVNAFSGSWNTGCPRASIKPAESMPFRRRRPMRPSSDI